MKRCRDRCRRRCSINRFLDHVWPPSLVLEGCTVFARVNHGTLRQTVGEKLDSKKQEKLTQQAIRLGSPSKNATVRCVEGRVGPRWTPDGRWLRCRDGDMRVGIPREEKKKVTFDERESSSAAFLSSACQLQGPKHPLLMLPAQPPRLFSFFFPFRLKRPLFSPSLLVALFSSCTEYRW